MTLTAKQREVIERMAAGQQLKLSRYSRFASLNGVQNTQDLTVEKMLELGLIRSLTVIYDLTELGRAAAKGEA